MQSTLLDYFSKLTGAVIGQLPEGNALCVQLAPSSEGTQYLSGASSDDLSLLFLCRNENQQTALSTLEQICNTLTRTKAHPHGIYRLSIATQPNYVDREGKSWVYSCIINCRYYNQNGFS